MAKKEFKYYGKTLDELKKMSLNEFAEIAPARIRRTLKKGFTKPQKILLKKIKNEKEVKTHCKDIIILPEMVDAAINVHNGQSFIKIVIKPEMIGHYLGEFVLTRKGVSHSAPGIGATRSSAALSVK